MSRRSSSGNLPMGGGLNPFKRSKPGTVPLQRKPSRGPSLSLDDEGGETTNALDNPNTAGDTLKDSHQRGKHNGGDNVFLDGARVASTAGPMKSLTSKSRRHTTGALLAGAEPPQRQQLFQRQAQNPFAAQRAPGAQQARQQKPQLFKQQQQRHRHQQRHQDEQLHLLLDGEPLQDLGTDTETDVDDDDDDDGVDDALFHNHSSLRPARHHPNHRFPQAARGMAQSASARGRFGDMHAPADAAARGEEDNDDREHGPRGGVLGGGGGGDLDDEHVWSTQHPATSDEGTGPEVLTPPGTQALTQASQSSNLLLPPTSPPSSAAAAYSRGTTQTAGALLLAPASSAHHPRSTHQTSSLTRTRKASLPDAEPAPPLSRHSSLDVEGVTRSFGSLTSRSLSVSSLSTALPSRETRPRVHARSHTAVAEHMDTEQPHKHEPMQTQQQQQQQPSGQQLQPRRQQPRHRRRGGMSEDNVHPPSIFDEVLGTGLKRPEPRVGQNQRQKTATPKPSVLVTSTGPPVDLSLKTKLTVASPHKLRALCYPTRAGKARALHAAMTESQAATVEDEEQHEDVAETLAHSLHYFAFPDITVSDTVMEPTFPTGRQEQLDVMRDMWEEAANSLWDGVNEGLCDYFYVLAADFELLLWRRPLRAVLTRTSRGLRRLLDSKGVKYCSPRDGSEEMQQAEEVESELEALQDVFKIRRRPSRGGVGSATSEILIRDPESVAALRPVITQLLFMNESGRRTKQPPILLSNSPFLNAQLKCVPVRYVGPVLQRNNEEEEVLEITGPLLPRMVHGVLSMLERTVPQFTLRMTALHYTHQFNTGVQWDKDTCLLLQTRQRGMTLKPDFASTVYMKRVRGYQLQFRKSHGFVAMAPAAPNNGGSAS